MMKNCKVMAGEVAGVLIFVLMSALFICGCGPTKKTVQSKAGQTKVKGAFNLRTAMHSRDTLAVRQFLAGAWKLERICRSTFTGLQCDTSIKQTWQLDSLGRITWITEGDNAGNDQYHFVSREGVQAGTAKGNSVWVLYLNRARRAYLIRTLTRDSMAIADYPLIMDNTTTYYLSR